MIPWIGLAGSVGLLAVSGWLFPATPFNGLSVLALAITWFAGINLMRKAN